MTTTDIIAHFEKMGTAQTKKTYFTHGASEPLFGVKVQDMKTLQKTIRKDYELSLSLFRSGYGEAMYMAGLISDPGKMTKDDLQEWASLANWNMVSEYTVPWTASESRYGRELALEWVNSGNARLRATGWNTYGSLVALKKDADLNLPEITGLLQRIVKEIHGESERVKYTMNGFVIAVGHYVLPLTETAKKAAVAIGEVRVDMGDTYCKVPSALSYIEKAETAGRQGKKRKTAFC